MTLKVRIAVMMMLLVMAVLAVQFTLNAREQRDLAERVARINEALNVSTGDAAKMAIVLSERHGPPVLPNEVRVPAAPGTHATLRIVATTRAGGDSATRDTLVDLPPGDPESARRLVDSLRASFLKGGPTSKARVLIEEIRGEELSDSALTLSRVEMERRRTGRGSSGEIRDSLFTEELSWVGDALPFRHAGVGDAFVFQVPLVFPQKDSLAVLELRYPTDELTDALSRSRRRGFFWMTSLLGVGALGAWMMAVQFTRPLRKLEASFRRVEHGELEAAAVPVGRHDEIGALTTSFNRMVERLGETRAMEQRLIENERLAAVGRLAAGVAHEVRNPLNAIQLTMRQLRDRTAPAEEAPSRADFDRYYASVTGELQRLDRLVTTFLDLSQPHALPLERLDLVETLRSAARLFAPDAEEKGVRLTLEPHEPVWIMADPSRLPTVWNNLLSNAIRACDRGASITLSVRVPGDGTVAVSVTDTGAGMSNASMEKMWEPFYSERADGTGLGLSIVKTVVERHGGSVAATSAPRAGTTITVTLPLPREGAGT